MAAEEPADPPPFYPIPVWVVHIEASWGAKVLSGVLASYEGRASPTAARLASDMGATLRTVSRWVGELVEQGVVCVCRTGRASTYRLARPTSESREEGPPSVAPAPADAPTRAELSRLAVSERTDRLERRERLRLLSKVAMARAIERAGGVYLSEDRPEHMEVGEVAGAWADKFGLDVQTTLDGWAIEWLAVAKARSARSWLSWVTAKVSGRPWSGRTSDALVLRMGPDEELEATSLESLRRRVAEQKARKKDE